MTNITLPSISTQGSLQKYLREINERYESKDFLVLTYSPVSSFEEKEIQVQDSVSLDISLPRFIAAGDKVYGKYAARSNDFDGPTKAKNNIIFKINRAFTLFTSATNLISYLLFL